tara:strand:+ start:3360 stop:3719 length:360 start_codon:yes stop_codon:yes gene_type:complete
VDDNADYIMVSSLRRELGKNSSEDTEASIEDEILENDLNLLSDKCTKLLNLLTMFSCLLGVLWIWAHVFPAFGIVDSFSFWHQTIIVDDREISDPVTPFEIFRALGVSVGRRCSGLSPH